MNNQKANNSKSVPSDNKNQKDTNNEANNQQQQQVCINFYFRHFFCVVANLTCCLWVYWTKEKSALKVLILWKCSSQIFIGFYSNSFQNLHWRKKNHISYGNPNLLIVPRKMMLFSSNLSACIMKKRGYKKRFSIFFNLWYWLNRKWCNLILCLINV